MKKFVIAVVLMFLICAPSFAQITTNNLYAIYDNANGHVQIFPNGDGIKANFWINKMKAEGYGEIEGRKAVLYLDNDEEVTIIFGDLKNKLVETRLSSFQRHV